jgi:hypothetical protein
MPMVGHHEHCETVPDAGHEAVNQRIHFALEHGGDVVDRCKQEPRPCDDAHPARVRLFATETS